MKFKDYVDMLRRAGKCQCFDCLRRAGYTPPKVERAHHPSISPYAVWGKDVGGEPVITQGARKKDKEDAYSDMEASEGHNLREAVRNRSAI